MLPPTLSDLPLELLDIILSRFYHTPQGCQHLQQDLPSLLQALLLNKRFSSIAIKHLYRTAGDPGRSIHQEKAKQLFNTLLLSAKNKTILPYCVNTEEFSLDRWCALLAPGGRIQTRKGSKVLRDLRVILRAILEHGQLRSFEMEYPQHLGLMATLPDSDVSILKSFRVSFHGNAEGKDSKFQSRIKALTSQMRLKTLAVNMHCPTDLDCLDFQSNTLSAVHLGKSSVLFGQETGVILLRYTQRLLTSQSQTLTSLTLFQVNLVLTPSMSLPNLEVLTLCYCRVAGWENVYTSLSALTHLDLSDVYFLNKPELGHPGRLQALKMNMCWCYEYDVMKWLLEEYSKSFRNLRVLDVEGFMTVNAVANILSNNHFLWEFNHIHSSEKPEPDDDSSVSGTDELPPPPGSVPNGEQMSYRRHLAVCEAH